jgi:hypothetical protein
MSKRYHARISLGEGEQLMGRYEAKMVRRLEREYEEGRGIPEDSMIRSLTNGGSKKWKDNWKLLK